MFEYRLKKKSKQKKNMLSKVLGKANGKNIFAKWNMGEEKEKQAKEKHVW